MSLEITESNCLATAGSIFDIQRFSIHDGPGIRTTVFMKGCPLHCMWCHNPESRSDKPQLAFYKSKCIGCGRCLAACPNGAILEGELRIDRRLCQLCGKCAEACPSEALQMIGRTASVTEIVDVVLRDLPFYKTSKGGATLSGGEPMRQFEFSLCLLKTFKEHDLHTAIETCGLAQADQYREIAKFCNLFLMDIKVIDTKKHKNLCGVDNDVIKANAAMLSSEGADIIIRTPLIPGLNDSPDDIAQLGEFVLSLPRKHKLELMAYHRIGSGKYEALGMEYPIPDIEPPADMDGYKNTLLAMGIEVI